MLEKVRKYFPEAVSSSDFVLNTYKTLVDYNLPPEKIMLAHSICSDDVNAIEYPEEGKQMLGPFNLGGLMVILLPGSPACRHLHIMCRMKEPPWFFTLRTLV